LKLVQERAGNTLGAIGIDNDFFSRNKVVQQLREMIDKWDYMKLKSFCITNDIVSKLKRPSTEWEKNLCQLYITQVKGNQNIQGVQKN
jgi:hypothetical protein